MNLDLFFEIYFRIDEIVLMRENPTQKRYFYHICKYPKKSFQHLKIVFIPTWLKEFKDMDEIKIKQALF